MSPRHIVKDKIMRRAVTSILVVAFCLVSFGLAGPAPIHLDKFGGASIASWPAGVTKDNVVALYGRPGGIRVMAGGYDVCSIDYTHRVLKKSQFHAAIRPKYQDLSGPPETFVEPGWLALDPVSKRIKFSQGNPIAEFRWIDRLDLGGFGTRTAVIDGNIAYLACTEDGSGVLFLDISDPKAMKVVGNCPIPGFPGLVAKRGNLLYVYGANQLTVVDVSDLAHPRPVNGIHDLWHIGRRKGPMILIGDQYLAMPHGTFVTVFRTYPNGGLDPVAVWRLPGGYDSFVLKGNRLVLAGEKGVHVLDVSQPEKPTILQATDEHCIRNIRAIGDRFVGVSGGLVLFTVSAAGEVEVGPPVPCDNVMDLGVVDAGLLVLTGRRGNLESASLRLYRVKDGAIEARPVSIWNEQGFLDAVHYNADNSLLTTSGNRVLVSDFNFGPRLFLVQGEKLIETDAMMMAGESRGMRIEEDYLHVAKNGLILIDVFTDPAHPRRVGDVYTRSGCFGLASWAHTKRKIVYHASSLDAAPRLIEYSDPVHPKIINERPPWCPGGVWKDGLMIGFSGMRGQLVTYEVAESGRFCELAAIDVPGWKVGARTECWMRQVGDLIYVAIGRIGPGVPFSVLDISNPLACKLIGQVKVDVARGAGIGTPGLYVDSDIAYLGGCAHKGILVIDCHDPANPRCEGFIDPVDPSDPGLYSKAINCPDEITVVGDKLILGDYITGLRLYQFTNPQRTAAKYVNYYLAPPEYSYSVYMNSSGMDYHGRYLYKSNMHDLQVYEIPAPSDVPAGPVTVEAVK